MQRFKEVLVVVDEKTENRPVVERAVALAQRNQARLTVVDTVGALPHQADHTGIACGRPGSGH